MSPLPYQLVMIADLRGERRLGIEQQLIDAVA